MSSDPSTLNMPALEFKSSSLSVLVMLLTTNNLTDINQDLRDKVKQAPDFFKNSPILIDLQKLNGLNLTISIKDIVNLLLSQGFLPIGIRGGNEQQNIESIELKLPVHSIYGQNNATVTEKKIEKKPYPSEDVHSVSTSLSNKLITHPVRSGQRVYAKGDLIITATVSAGAEIMAEGNIHIYGSLRGRALAGVQGNTESRIFCSDLQAELISIAGIYQLSDDLDRIKSHKPVQISLENQKLIIKEV